MICDVCFGDLKGDAVLKQPCAHRMHKGCESKDADCTACKSQEQFRKVSFLGMLVFAGLLVGLMIGFYSLRQESSVRTMVYELEIDLRKMEQLADRSLLARFTVQKTLDRVKEMVRQEIFSIQRK